MSLSLILLFPLMGFLFNGSWYGFFQSPVHCKKANASITGWLATLSIFVSFLVSGFFFFQLKDMPESSRVLEQSLFSWMSIGSFHLDFALRLDSLSILFALVITGVGTLIHLYSIGYMSHDPKPGKFFAYLNLFCFAMLILVLGASLPVMFLGWEGVGLCSYLLIGYWYEDLAKASAGKKAFVVNRIGDLGFLLGMFLIFTSFGTFDFKELHAAIVQGNAQNLPRLIESGTITLIGLMLFLGCCGKSAQIPLFVWLPDAMAGPTPVSALIHAATMVTSGIYLVSRLNFLYNLSPVAMEVIAIIGACTAFSAGTIAIAQRDIKKVLAYSTVSQLGYMFLGCGVGAYTAGVFHVMTHAFFKALLFLGAGSVIHGMHEEQDIMKMGGLKKHMPKTFFVFAVAWLAICGVPPFSGFFSKDEILWQAFSSSHGSVFLWGLGALTAIMTAFYMTRLFRLTFLGEERFDHHKTHVHESPNIMIVPLMVLAVLSAIGGWIGIPHYSWLEHWLEPVIPTHEIAGAESSGSLEWVLMGVSVAGALFGIFLAWNIYKDLKKAEVWKNKLSKLYAALWNKWYIDEIYEAAFVNPIRGFSEGLWKNFDIAVIDRIVLWFGRVSQFAGQTARVIQTGTVQVYALVLLFGFVLTVGYLIYGQH